MYIRSFENTCWGLAGGRFGASGRPRGGLWEASWRHLDVLGCRLRLCESALEGQLTSVMLYMDILSNFEGSRDRILGSKIIQESVRDDYIQFRRRLSDLLFDI